MSGLKSKRKGYRLENQTAKRWTARGIKCTRVVLSGALGHLLGEDFQGDLKATILGRNLTIQSKGLANGWRMIYAAIQQHDLLIIKSDHKESLVILPESLFLSLICGDSGDGSENERIPEAAK